jgi:hypothetical protein
MLSRGSYFPGELYWVLGVEDAPAALLVDVTYAITNHVRDNKSLPSIRRGKTPLRVELSCLLHPAQRNGIGSYHNAPGPSLRIPSALLFAQWKTGAS